MKGRVRPSDALLSPYKAFLRGLVRPYKALSKFFLRPCEVAVSFSCKLHRQGPHAALSAAAPGARKSSSGRALLRGCLSVCLCVSRSPHKAL